MTTRGKGDTVGRLLGALVFLGGIGIIVLTVTLAYRLFLDPLVALPPGSMGRNASVSGLVAGFGGLLVRVLLLLVLSLSGAFIASRGIRLYEVARRPSGESLPPE